MQTLKYQSGFGNNFATEAVPHALPVGQNSPQKVPYGLYAEQLSGSAFTEPRKNNLRSWLYRIQPSVLHSDFKAITRSHFVSLPFTHATPPTQMRWLPVDYPKQPTHFIDSLITMAGHGDAKQRTGAAVHVYACNQSMTDQFFYNADGDLLIVPQEGDLLLKTEMGLLDVIPNEIAVIPRGIKFQVVLKSEKARGYICENYGAHFMLPDLGPIGSNGLANARDFLTPVAHYEERHGHFSLITKFLGQLWQAEVKQSPLDVVAWHGNYVPYKYDLRLFNTMNSVSFDHADPSIFTVLTSPTTTPGLANVDFVIFPSRWVVMEHTMRLPYYHRNIMSEFMGLIYGEYDAKQSAFIPGGASLHNCMSPHGPDAASYEHAIKTDLKPRFYQDTLAFMFESCYPWQVSEFAQNNYRDKEYLQCWQGLKAAFKV